MDHLDEAVKEYEEKMFPRAKELLDEAEEIVQMFFDENAPAGFKKWLASIRVIILRQTLQGHVVRGNVWHFEALLDLREDVLALSVSQHQGQLTS